MSLAGGIIIFVIAWWLCFFMVLPIGVRGQWEDDSTVPGTEEAAPKNPMLAKKALWAAAGAAVVTVFAALVIPRLLAQ
jgi:predicted secreted protein